MLKITFERFERNLIEAYYILERRVELNNITPLHLKIIIFFARHTRIPGLWTQVLNAGLRTLDSGRWMLHFERWALVTGHCRWLFRTKSESNFWFCLINYWKFSECELLRTLWSRLFCRDYRFWCGYFRNYIQWNL